MTMSLNQIDAGIQALCENGKDLIEEASLLHEKSAYARSFALAHLGREELSKAHMLYATGIRIIAGHPVDWKNLMMRLRDHKSKLRLEIVNQAMTMIALGNGEMTKLANTLLTKEGAEALSSRRNDDKNAALYVGFIDGKFVLPRDTRTEYQSWRTIELAKVSHTEMEYLRIKSGPFALRKVGDLQMPNYDDPTVALQSLDQAAKAYAALQAIILGSSGNPEATGESESNGDQS